MSRFLFELYILKWTAQVDFTDISDKGTLHASAPPAEEEEAGFSALVPGAEERARRPSEGKRLCFF